MDAHKKLAYLLNLYIALEDKLTNIKINENYIPELFNLIDQSKKGFIEVSDLLKAFSFMSREEALSAFEFFDMNQSGILFPEDFSDKIGTSQYDFMKIKDKSQLKQFITSYMKIIQRNYEEKQQIQKNYKLSYDQINTILDNMMHDRKKKTISVEHCLQYFKQRGIDLNKQIVDYLIKSIFKSRQLLPAELAFYFRQFSWQYNKGQRKEQKIESDRRFVDNLQNNVGNKILKQEGQKYGIKDNCQWNLAEVNDSKLGLQQTKQMFSIQQCQKYPVDTSYSTFNSQKYRAGTYINFMQKHQCQKNRQIFPQSFNLTSSYKKKNQFLGYSKYHKENKPNLISDAIKFAQKKVWEIQKDAKKSALRRMGYI